MTQNANSVCRGTTSIHVPGTKFEIYTTKQVRKKYEKPERMNHIPYYDRFSNERITKTIKRYNGVGDDFILHLKLAG